ncbi:OV-16 antigen, variant 2 [Basidiobolus meristosporus CBS 931.73]|uniref:OV-16 antigen, variant 2 n=1 Tax=Basidiobolus meristosporus CBS 931.73 TaxID=1314790 RepID=A0A1Y1XUR5_9FUNG|nr:OV-16 antigen, variant 2 [Basidiobolus meristosporus CBS 931.73]|eukprot:ORX89024.1 OV-16 antigen, variant 2 [Basidiobolus meristosporus CBS 931.73]
MQSIKQAFTKAGIIPDVLQDTANATLLKVVYPGGKAVNLGEELSVEETQKQPEVHVDAKGDEKYTLIMSDPDAPSRKNPTLGEWRHWVVGNITGNDISKADAVTSYFGPAPPPGTGLHRYIFMLYQQNGAIPYEKLPEDPSQRGNFKTSDFVKQHNLKLVAANYFEAENKN